MSTHMYIKLHRFTPKILLYINYSYNYYYPINNVFSESKIFEICNIICTYYYE